MKPVVRAFFHAPTWTLTYVVHHRGTLDAVVIDAVLDYDPAASRLQAKPVDAVAAYLNENGLKLHWVLDTHAHADHFSGSRTLADRFPGARVGIGERIVDVQRMFGAVFNLGPDFPTDGRQFDALLPDGAVLDAGALEVRVIATPGHTPACVCFLVGDAVFTGDTLFMPDYGVGRCDFPSGSPEILYDSIMGRLYALPDDTRVFVGHDYQPGGREVLWESSVGDEKRQNVQLRATTPKAEFIEFRRARDRTLGAPRLLYQSVQFNIHGGRSPAPEGNGTAYLKIPLRG
jgi:glyoxylase-like metal-dependent hydrolase (beta-lactamase superfamily II)